MAQVRLKVDSRELRSALKVAPDKVINAMNKSLKRSVLHARNTYQTVMTNNGSVDTGFMRANIRYGFRDKLHANVGPVAPYARDVEFGTPPHYVPPSELRGWARRKGLNEYAVSKSIQKKGTKRHPFLERTTRETRRFAVANMQKTLDRAMEKIL